MESQEEINESEGSREVRVKEIKGQKNYTQHLWANLLRLLARILAACSEPQLVQT